MTSRPLPAPGVLQPEAVELLTAIRDHLNLPLYAEGDETARQAWADMQALRVADVVEALTGLLGVTARKARDTASALHAYRAETLADYATAEASQ
ncbi:hypothetical protein [Streptomyces sp. NPDC020983]|uniref:hypothetical protein n=1 Tax=Streptomyces sp. NPDC020983 TaxID=3365106 RepID=UPI0037B876C1